ncbi:YqcC family protein [Pseudaeromonas paramecii]|uniref:YqcC family protein n=1 Tax=Pseudaeromonas paramecii TaxID=2138166 RepID=A0ABP8Q539_9GAMM
MSATLLRLLDALEVELKHQTLWCDESPTPAQLASQLPFAVDSLDFHQWLQFIYLPRLRDLLAQGARLPSKVAVYPMACEVYKHELVLRGPLLECIAQLDEAMSGKAVER